jgi:ABC-type uncharacterized transport system substrate-binding protein
MTRSCRPLVTSLRLLLGGLLLHAGIALAHPHVWVKYSVHIETNGTSIVALDERWRFTEGFPVQLVGVDQLPAQGPLDAALTQRFHDQAFVSLAHTSYFTHLFVNGSPQAFGAPTHFQVSVEDGKITYAFRLPLAAPLDAHGKQVELGVWDPSFYVDYEQASTDAVSFTAATPSGTPARCTIRQIVDSAHPIFNGFVLPHASAITC